MTTEIKHPGARFAGKTTGLVEDALRALVTPPGLTRDADHIYRMNGRVVPGVTGILDAAGLIPHFGEKKHLDRGTFVHEATVLLEEDDLDREFVQRKFPGYLGYIDAWGLFLEREGWETFAAEKMLYSSWEYAGQLDRIGRRRGDIIRVNDIKTGEVQPYTELQTAGYVVAVEGYLESLGIKPGMYKLGRMATELHEDGTYTQKFFDDYQDSSRFVHEVGMYYWKIEKGLLKEPKNGK